MKKKIWDRFVNICYSGMEPDKFDLYEKSIHRQNWCFTRRVDLFSVIMLVVMLLSNFFTSYVSMMTTTFVTFLVIYVVEFGVRGILEHKGIYGNVTYRVWFCMTKIYLFAFASGIFWNLGATAFTFYIFLIALPILFIRPAWQMAVYVTTVCLIFAVLVWWAKPVEIAVADTYYTFICYICSLSISYWINSLRLRSIENEYLLTVQRDTDVLTGLYNRLRFNRYMAEVQGEKEKCGRNIMMIDVDSFKAYNDHYGHIMGDEILRKLGQAFLEFADEHHLFCARYGGEEFVIVDENHTFEEVELLAQSLLQKIRSLRLVHDYSRYGIITISIGCACQEHLESCGYIELINEADRALYQAKKLGRNQVCVCGNRKE